MRRVARRWRSFAFASSDERPCLRPCCCFMGASLIDPPAAQYMGRRRGWRATRGEPNGPVMVFAVIGRLVSEEDRAELRQILEEVHERFCQRSLQSAWPPQASAS